MKKILSRGVLVTGLLVAAVVPSAHAKGSEDSDDHSGCSSSSESDCDGHGDPCPLALLAGYDECDEGHGEEPIGFIAPVLALPATR
ncbi:MAG: hypothetical protein ACO3SP_10270 [Ilumatobacteraceae bacterium]